jgi:hypothetical protein
MRAPFGEGYCRGEAELPLGPPGHQYHPSDVWYVYVMRTKTTVYLDPQQQRLLAAIARDQGRSQAELIRMAVQSLIDASRPALPRFVGAGVEKDPVVPAETIKDFIRETVPQEFEARLARGRQAESA